MNLQGLMHQEITHWPVTGSDGFGGFLFGAPTLLTGRWEDKVELYRNKDNEEVASNSIVYLTVDVAINDYLAEGDFTDPAVADPISLNTTTTRSRRVEQQNRSTDLRNLTALRKVFL